MENNSGDALGERLGKSVGCKNQGPRKICEESEPETSKGGWLSGIWDKLGKREDKEVGSLKEAGEKVGQAARDIVSKMGLEITESGQIYRGMPKETHCFPRLDQKSNADVPILSLDKFEMKDEIRALGEELKRIEEEEKRTGKRTEQTYPQSQVLSTGDHVTRTSESDLILRLPEGEILELRGSKISFRDASGQKVANEHSRFVEMEGGKSFEHIVPFSGPGWYNIHYPNGDYVRLRPGDSGSGYAITIVRGTKTASLTTRK